MGFIDCLMGKIEVISLYNTNKCNINCIYCLSDKSKEDGLSFEDKISVIRQAKQMGAKAVFLAGSGEPMMDKDFFPLIKSISITGMKPVVLTNGILITRKVAKELKKNNVMIGMKIPSLDKKILEKLAGTKNAYKMLDFKSGSKSIKIPAFLKNLLEIFDTKDLRVSIPLTKINFESINEVIDFCEEYDIKIMIETLIYTGNAEKNISTLKLTDDQEKNLIELVKNRLPHFAKSGPCRFERNPVVESDGNIAVCLSRSANVGNVKDEPLAKLFKKLHKKYKNEFTRKIQNKTVGMTCNGLGNCRGREYYNKK